MGSREGSVPGGPPPVSANAYLHSLYQFSAVEFWEGFAACLHKMGIYQNICIFRTYLNNPPENQLCENFQGAKLISDSIEAWKYLVWPLRNWPFTTHTSMIENNTLVSSYLPTHIKRLWMLWMHQSLSIKSLSVCLPLDKMISGRVYDQKQIEGRVAFAKDFLNFTKIEVHK